MSGELAILSFMGFVWSLIQDDRSAYYVPIQIVRSNTFPVDGSIIVKDLASTG